MKEVDLIIDENGELSFINPEPYVRINVLTKETYEKLVNVIDKQNAPMEATIEIDYRAGVFSVCCPVYRTLLAKGKITNKPVSLSDIKYCTKCGQAIAYSEVQQ